MSFVKTVADAALAEVASAFPDVTAGEADAFRPTEGYYGRAGAGAVLYSIDLGQFCLFQRAATVSQSGTWGTVGGVIDPGETPEQACLREIGEEIGYFGPIEFLPLFDYKDRDFHYTNFIGVVPKEFRPNIEVTDEVSGYKWSPFGRWPNPLHFGFEAILKSPEAMDRLMAIDSGPGLI